MTARPPFGRLPEPKTPVWFKVWFAFCAVLGVGALALVAWLVVAAIGWLERN